MYAIICTVYQPKNKNYYYVSNIKKYVKMLKKAHNFKDNNKIKIK